MDMRGHVGVRPDRDRTSHIESFECGGVSRAPGPGPSYGPYPLLMVGGSTGASAASGGGV
jgi:hypothetical protein